MFDIENGIIENALTKIKIPTEIYRCMTINIKVDILQKQFFLEIYRSNNIQLTSYLTSLIKKWYTYLQKLNCMTSIKKGQSL